jgi:hypothetical protein
VSSIFDIQALALSLLAFNNPASIKYKFELTKFVKQMFVALGWAEATRDEMRQRQIQEWKTVISKLIRLRNMPTLHAQGICKCLMIMSFVEVDIMHSSHC